MRLAYLCLALRLIFARRSAIDDARAKYSLFFNVSVSPTDAFVVLLHTSVCPAGFGPRISNNHLVTVFCDITLKSNQTYSVYNDHTNRFSMVTVAVLGSLGLLVLIVLLMLVFFLVWKYLMTFFFSFLPFLNGLKKTKFILFVIRRYFSTKQYKFDPFTTPVSIFEDESYGTDMFVRFISIGY